MNSVFIGGSRMISNLSEEIKVRLRNIISKNFTVLIGDANGSDKAVQRFFLEKRYKSVLIYCSGQECRNNLGAWKTIHVDAPNKTKNRKFYGIKDAKMATDCDYGFMLWDAESSGTLNNVLNIISYRKPCLLYIAPQREFVPIKSPAELESITRTLPIELLSELDEKIELRERLEKLTSFSQDLLTGFEVREAPSAKIYSNLKPQAEFDF